MQTRLLRSPLAVLGLALVVSSCGDGLLTTTTPSSPTGGGGSTPTPAPTPTAIPAPTATPGVKSCTLAPQPNCSTEKGPYEFGCCTEKNIESPEAAFVDAIAEAQGFLANSRPELFNGNLVKPGSERAYTAAIVKRIGELNGMCAAAPSWIPEDEITLKSRQDRGEIFDIIQGDGTPTRRFATLCLPAAF